jgi:HK97 family phage portal protein
MKKTKAPAFLKEALSGCARWLGVPADAGDGFAYNLDGVPRTDGIGSAINVTTAMQLSAVWACVTLLSDTISTLPLSLYRRKRNGTREVAEDHPVHLALKYRPNDEQTPSRFMGAFMASMLLRDAGYAEKLVFNGTVVGHRSLVRDRLQISTKADGSKEYRYTENGRTRIIPPARIWRVPGFTLNGFDGCSAIRYGAQVMGTARAADSAAQGTFLRGLLPTTWFSYPKVLKPDQRADARKAIEQLSGAQHSGSAIVLEAGMETGSVGINPNDAQLLESRAFSVEEICSWFRVQPFMIGRASKGQTNWGTGIEQQMIGFIVFTLRPWLKRIEESIAAELLTPAERATYYAEFNLEGLLRGDSAARAAFYQTLLNNGVLCRNEVRALENLPPIEGGDIYTVQSALIPLTSLGDAPDPGAAVRSMLLTWLKVPEERAHEPA